MTAALTCTKSVGRNWSSSPKSCKRIGQRPGGAERRRGAGPARLQIDVDVVPRAEGGERGAISLARRIEHAKHQRGRAIAHGGLDLRQALPHAARVDQLRELGEHAVERRRQHGAAQHVRDVWRRALAKADQHAILARHELDAEAGTPPIAPYGPGRGGKPFVRLDAADARERLRNRVLLEAHLCIMREVLKRTAAAAAEVLALRA